MAAFESEIRKFIRRDAPPVRQSDGELQQRVEPISDRRSAQIHSASEDAIACIDRVILDLQDVRNMLRSEAERLHHEVNNYLDLSHAAKIAARAIAESLAKSRIVPGNLDRPAAE